MAISIRVAPTMPTRPCRFCLALQEDGVFADFGSDDEGLVFLRRISFDGYGCCRGDFGKMDIDDSRLLMESVDRGAIGNPGIERALRTYFAQNADVIWRDALREHGLL